MMSRLQITNEVFALVDAEDIARLPSTAVTYLDRHGYPQIRGWSEEYRTTVVVSLHRWVMGSPRGQFIDHINGDRLDCRKCNLRIASVSENARNRKKLTRTFKGQAPTSKYKGVCASRSGKWTAQIKAYGKSVHIGTFSTEEAAARAYDSHARQAFGDFAKLNFGIET